MASLIPCSRCLRHVRRDETQCPFCGAACTPAAAAVRPVLREAKRATLFALGLTLAGQACGGKEDEGKNRDDVGLVPPYGISFDPVPSGGSGGTSAVGNGEGGSESRMSTPPYGGTFHPPAEGGSGGEESDAGSPDDAGSDDASGGDAGNEPDAAG